VVRGYGAVPTLVQGFAMGTFFIALLTITFDRLPADKLPAASGLNNFLRITASGFATSLTTTFWDRRESLHQTRLVESLTAFSPAFRQGVRNHHELRTQRSLG
jgi:DHA2 family multidrug resistance protein